MQATMIRPETEHQGECCCDQHNSFCAVHGTWTPATDDLEVISAVSEAARKRRTARRIVRKRGGLTW